MDYLRKLLIIIFGIIIPSSALGMKITIDKNLSNQRFIVEFNFDCHKSGHELYKMVESTIDLLKIIIKRQQT